MEDLTPFLWKALVSSVGFIVVILTYIWKDKAKEDRELFKKQAILNIELSKILARLDAQAEAQGRDIGYLRDKQI